MKPIQIARKIKTVMLHPVDSAKVLGYHFAQRNGRNKLVQLGLKEQLEKVEAKCAATGAFAPNYMELWHLYDDVRRLQPDVVFEFGSGLSTNIMAAALAANLADGRRSGKLFSFESEKKWWDASDQWLDAKTRSFVELVFSPVRVEVIAGEKVFKYSNIPSLIPHMMYLDGPALTPEIRAAADLLDMETFLKPGFWLVIDGRRDNAEFLDRHLKRKYNSLIRSGFLGGSYLQRCYELQG